MEGGSHSSLVIMSYELGRYSSSSTSCRRPELDLSKVNPSLIQKRNYIPISPIQFDRVRGREILDLIGNCPIRPYYMIPDLIDFGDWGSEFKKFFAALEAYERAEGSAKDIPISTLIERCLLEGPEFSKEIKDYKFKRVVESLTFPCLIKPEERLRRISQIFNYQYFPTWEEEVDDLPISSEMYQKLSDSQKEEFIRNLDELLPDQLEEIDPIDILLEISTSASGVDSASKVWKDKGSQKKNTFSDQPLNARRVKIPVGPCSFRDTIILDINQSNSIKLIDRQVWKLLEEVPNHCMYKSSHLIKDRIERFGKKFSFFINRDIEKDGLTKNRELLVLTLQHLSKKFPNCRAFDLWGIYTGFTVDGQYYPRGVGLGMANALTTLIQVVIFNIIIDRCTENDNLTEEIDALIYNDDFTMGAQSQEDLEIYWDQEDLVLKEFGLPKKDSKSFRSAKGFVFLEEYYPPSLNDKRSYECFWKLKPVTLGNIIEAKSLVSSLDLSPKELEEIVSYWGYEFCPSEFSWPSSFGGWRKSNIDGLDISFHLFEEFDPRMYKSYLATKQEPHIRFKDYGSYYGPASYLFDFFEENRELLNYPIEKLKFSLESIKANPNLYRYFFEQLLKLRWTKFIEQSNVSLLDFFNEFFDDKKGLVLVPSRFATSRIMIETRSKEFSDPRDQDTRVLPLLSHLTGRTFYNVFPDDRNFKGKYREFYSLRKKEDFIPTWEDDQITSSMEINNIQMMDELPEAHLQCRISLSLGQPYIYSFKEIKSDFIKGSYLQRCSEILSEFSLNKAFLPLLVKLEVTHEEIQYLLSLESESESEEEEEEAIQEFQESQPETKDIYSIWGNIEELPIAFRPSAYGIRTAIEQFVAFDNSPPLRGKLVRSREELKKIGGRNLPTISKILLDDSDIKYEIRQDGYYLLTPKELSDEEEVSWDLFDAG